MEYAEPQTRPFPWRAATLVAAAIATVELLALIIAAAFLLARPLQHKTRAVTAVHHAALVTRSVAHTVRAVRPAPHVLRPRDRVAVLVLNGNGIGGAAAREADKLHRLGYRIGGSTNATRHDYARSMVMYVPSFAREARRLARDTGIRLVSPVDGLTPRALRGVKLVVLLGS